MTKAKVETPEQAERRRERNRQRRKAEATAKRHEAAVKTVMERAAAAGKAAGATSKAVEATKPATMTVEAPKAPQTPTATGKASTLADRAVAMGFQVGVNGQLIDNGHAFYPFCPDDLLSSQGMLANEAAIRGRARGALEALAEFFANRVTGRVPSKAEMRLAGLVESLANELSAVADAIPQVLADLDHLRKEADRYKVERDQLKEEKRHTASVMRQFVGTHVYIEDWPEA